MQSSPSDAVSILKSAIETSKSSPYWHLRLILKLIRLKSENNQIDRQKYLDIGAKLASDSSSPYLKILFLLAKSLDQLKTGSFGPDFDKSLSQIESMTNQQTSLPEGQLHSIKLFLQSLQVKYMSVILTSKSILAVKISSFGRDQNCEIEAKRTPTDSHNGFARQKRAKV